MEKTYRIEFAQLVDKDLEKINQTDKKRILENIFQKLSTHPEHFSKPLKNTLKNFRSLRVGSYRVVFLVQESRIVIQIICIGHRKDVYNQTRKRNLL